MDFEFVKRVLNEIEARKLTGVEKDFKGIKTETLKYILKRQNTNLVMSLMCSKEIKRILQSTVLEL